MGKKIVILGNGQIWDIKGIDPANPEKIFEDLFSGRALGELASCEPIFSRFSENKKITGLSVTKALLSSEKKAKNAAIALLKHIAKNGAEGIRLLTSGRAIKPSWNNSARNYWKDLDGVIIGGGVSSGKTGEVIVKYIQKYLKNAGFGNIKIFKAEFCGKESGFLGAIAYNFDAICNEGLQKNAEKIIGLGIDVGRSKIGIGAVAINPKTKKVIVGKDKNVWLFQRSVGFPDKHQLHIFKDSDKRYSSSEKKLGRQLRNRILEEMANLCFWAVEKAEALEINCSRYIGAGLPGEAAAGGYLIGSTHYLPFFRKQDNFYFSKELEKKIKNKGMLNYCVNILNDGIAAGLANLRFGIGLENLKEGKYAFLGPGSGLGGFVGQIRKV